MNIYWRHCKVCGRFVWPWQKRTRVHWHDRDGKTTKTDMTHRSCFLLFFELTREAGS